MVALGHGLLAQARERLEPGREPDLAARGVRHADSPEQRYKSADRDDLADSAHRDRVGLDDVDTARRQERQRLWPRLVELAARDRDLQVVGELGVAGVALERGQRLLEPGEPELVEAAAHRPRRRRVEAAVAVRDQGQRFGGVASQFGRGAAFVGLLQHAEPDLHGVEPARRDRLGLGDPGVGGRARHVRAVARRVWLHAVVPAPAVQRGDRDAQAAPDQVVERDRDRRDGEAARQRLAEPVGDPVPFGRVGADQPRRERRQRGHGPRERHALAVPHGAIGSGDPQHDVAERVLRPRRERPRRGRVERGGEEEALHALDRAGDGATAPAPDVAVAHVPLPCDGCSRR